MYGVWGLQGGEEGCCTWQPRALSTTINMQLLTGQLLKSTKPPVGVWRDRLPCSRLCYLTAPHAVQQRPPLCCDCMMMFCYTGRMTAVLFPCAVCCCCCLSCVLSDVLRHLTSVELARNAAGVQTDRLAALASHVIGQRRWVAGRHHSLLQHAAYTTPSAVLIVSSLILACMR